MTTMRGADRVEVRQVYHAGRIEWGRVQGEEITLESGVVVPCARAQHLAPVTPSKIICVHLNYDERRVELGAPEPEQVPSYFMKPTTSLIGHQGTVYRPRGARYLNYEGEVAVVLGRRVRGASVAEAESAIAGYAPANDIGCHDFRDVDRGSMLRVKGMDGFCAVGPGLVSGVDVLAATLRTYLNGAVVQQVAVADMMFSPAYLIADLSRYMTLLPGDVILSGTPANSRPMAPGDTVEVEVTGVGRLRNVIAEAPTEVDVVGFPATDSAHAARVSLGGDYRAAPPDPLA